MGVVYDVLIGLWGVHWFQDMLEVVAITLILVGFSGLAAMALAHGHTTMVNLVDAAKDRRLIHYVGWNKCTRCKFFNHDKETRHFLRCGVHGHLIKDCGDFEEVS